MSRVEFNGRATRGVMRKRVKIIKLQTPNIDDYKMSSYILNYTSSVATVILLLPIIYYRYLPGCE